MSTPLAVVERRHDGKLYPEGGKRTPEELQRAISAVHELRCRDGLSLRRIVAELAAQHGLRVSVGSVHHYATAWACERCQSD